jgi:hypothetical protein
MKKLLALVLASTLALAGCQERTVSQETKDRQTTDRIQSQVAKSQPVPAYNWSLERHLVISLYNIRNSKAATHSVWRSNTGEIEGDCPSIGFGIPYDTSLTNPLKVTREYMSANHGYAVGTIEQAEPNSIFASKNTSATWVMCAGEMGSIEPIYVETKVTVYPYPVDVNYKTNRAIKAGKSSVTISSGK